MRTIYEVASVVLVCLLLLQPTHTGVSQGVLKNEKAIENTELKVRIDNKTDTIISNLTIALQNAEDVANKAKKSRVVYRTKIKVIYDTVYIVPMDTVNFVLNNDIIHDTVFFEILKKSRLHKMIYGSKNDTIFSSRKPDNK